MIRVLVRILLALVVLVLIAIAGVLLHGWVIGNGPVDRPARAVAAPPADSAAVARGMHIATVACASCHSPNGELPLAGGGENFLAIPNGPTFGVQWAPNLTPGGRLGVYSDAELARAIREGINHEGRGLLVMPSQNFAGFSDGDVAALIAALRAQPAVAREVPKRRINALGCAMLGLHIFPNSVQPAVTAPVADVAKDSTAAYGHYMVAMLGCRDCHGADLRGGRQGQFPPIGPDLVGFASAHPPELLDRALTTGVGSAGQPLNPDLMPWKNFQHLDHVEIRAVYEFLKKSAG